MKRELKFRAYCDIGDENKMLYFTEGKYDNGLWFEHTSNHIDEYLSPLMQFTGLQDKNGVDIYEGDIVSHGVIEAKSYVIFNDGSFSLSNKRSSFDSCIRHYALEEVEVIGNIHENPELL